jgi:hypothetical protein
MGYVVKPKYIILGPTANLPSVVFPLSLSSGYTKNLAPITEGNICASHPI